MTLTAPQTLREHLAATNGSWVRSAPREWADEVGINPDNVSTGISRMIANGEVEVRREGDGERARISAFRYVGRDEKPAKPAKPEPATVGARTVVREVTDTAHDAPDMPSTPLLDEYAAAKQAYQQISALTGDGTSKWLTVEMDFREDPLAEEALRLRAAIWRHDRLSE